MNLLNLADGKIHHGMIDMCKYQMYIKACKTTKIGRRLTPNKCFCLGMHHVFYPTRLVGHHYLWKDYHHLTHLDFFHTSKCCIMQTSFTNSCHHIKWPNHVFNSIDNWIYKLLLTHLSCVG